MLVFLLSEECSPVLIFGASITLRDMMLCGAPNGIALFHYFDYALAYLFVGGYSPCCPFKLHGRPRLVVTW